MSERTNLRSIDLNLLVVLDALLSERHVTRASNKVGLSQPAVSNALNRLRAMFDDELLVRTASGMKPTPRALELVDPLRQLLRQAERVLESDGSFDATTTRRMFTIRMSDILACILLPQLIAQAREAPDIGFTVLHLPPGETIDALDRDEIDLAVSMGLDHSNAICSEALLRDRMVCVMRRIHPLAKRKTLSFDDFIAQDHMKVSMSPADDRFVDNILGALGHRRRIVLNAPHWLTVPHVLRQTDLLAVMPAHLARMLTDADLKTFDVPFQSEPFFWMMYWHRRYDQSNANQWLRARVKQACAALSGSADA